MFDNVETRLNWDAVKMAVKTGLALGCNVNLDSRFDRKHYFYADLPLGYQITQQYRPLCVSGEVQLHLKDGSRRVVRIERMHIEQDSGKLIHERDASLLDLNRAGSALVEIVSAPDMRSTEEAAAYVTKLARLLQFIGTCDADLSKGNFRMDVNVSVAQEDTIHESLGTRCEIKNLNSLVRMRDAIEYEVKRHIGLMSAGSPIQRETRGWDTKRKATYSLRDKESAVDYRFMRDGDLPRLILTQRQIDEIRAELRETPAQKVARYCSAYGLSDYDAESMALDPQTSHYFEAVLSQCRNKDVTGQAVCNWISNELIGLMNAAGIFSMEAPPVSALQMASLLDAICAGQVSGKLAKRVIRVMFDRSASEAPLCDAIVKEYGWDVISDEAILGEVAQRVLEECPNEVATYHQGDDNKKQRMLKHFMGTAMKMTKGKADPELMKEQVEKALKGRE